MKNKKVKIVATLGPATNTSKMILDLALAGVDVFRLNLSHLQHDTVMDLVKSIREVEKKINKPLTIMGDLGGLKVRVGKIEEDTVLVQGQEIKIAAETVTGSSKIFSINYPTIISQLKKGTEILVDDGLIKLIVTKPIQDKFAVARVEVGGRLLSRKGFFAQDISLSDIGIPKKDEEDIKLMKKLQVDALAVSFVQSEYDLMQVRQRLGPDSNIVLIAKIETVLAVDNIKKIIKESDGIMIARGDLGLALPVAQVPLLQKSIIDMCLKHGKPVITATQMLESMTKSPFPTRAEVADVANAILDGTDAVMLSDETATGSFPVEAVSMMSQIITTTSPSIKTRSFEDQSEIAHVVSSSAGLIADKVGAKVILAFTQSGFSAIQIARHRYSQEVIVALSPNEKTLKKLNFCWGVYPQYTEKTNSLDHALKQTKDFIHNNNFIKLKKGDPYVIVTGLPFNQTGLTNLIHVERV